MYELKRIFGSPKHWLILLLIAAVNLALFAGYCRSIPELTPAESAEYSEYIAEGYAAYLERVTAQSEEQSVLGALRPADDFVSRNLQKTRDDYAKLNGITVTSGENRGICAVTDFGVTDFLLLILPLLLVLSFAHERHTQITDLLRTAPNGRIRLTAWRVLAVLLLSCVCVMTLYGGNILFACGLFGNPDGIRAVQSIPAFQLCAYRISVGGYLFAAAVIKVFAVWLFALTVWLIWSIFHQLLAIAISAISFGAAWICHRLILPTADLNLLKFCNPFAMLTPETFFIRYANLNLLGRPYGFLRCMAVWGCVSVVVCVMLCVILLGICRPVTVGAAAERIKDRIAEFACRYLPRHTPFGYEGRKILLSEGGILVLLAGTVYGVSLYRSMQISAPMNPDLTAIYMEYEGEVTEDKTHRCENKIDVLEEAVAERERTLARLMQAENPDERMMMDLRSEIALLRYQIELYTAFLDRMHSLIQYREETGYDAWLLRQNGWNLLFTETAPIRRCCTAMLIVLVFLFSPVMAYENRFGISPLLRSTKNGRGALLSCKIVWTVLLTLLVAAAFHGIFLYRLIQNVQLPLPGAPAHSLDLLRILPFQGSLYLCVMMLYVLRYLAASVFAAAVLCISRICRHPQASLFAALAIFLLPAALAEIGMPLLDPVRFLVCCI